MNASQLSLCIHFHLHYNPERIFLYNGDLKNRQDVHQAVINIDAGGKEDLQQCADAVMRMKAEYHFSRKEATTRERWQVIVNLYLPAACSFRSFLSLAGWHISGLQISLKVVLSRPIFPFILSGPISVESVCWPVASVF